MKASDIGIKDLKTGYDCARALREIPRDPDNFKGPLGDWISGHAPMTDEARLIVRRINQRMAMLAKEVW